MVLSTFEGADVDPTITEAEDVTVAPDGTLYLAVDAPGQFVYHTERDGELIEGPVDMAAFGATSIQSIEYDWLTDTLLVICNGANSVFRIGTGDRWGQLIGGPVYLGDISPQPGSWQSISIDPYDGHWWVAGYDPNVVLKLRAGTAIVMGQLSMPFGSDIRGVNCVPDDLDG